VEALDRGFAEFQKRLRRRREVRGEEEQRLLEITEIADESGANATRNVLDERVEVFECLFFKYWLYDVTSNVSLSVFAQELFCA
jgi:hypothetical protein